MEKNIMEFHSFVNENMNPQEALTKMIMDVKNDKGWIDPDDAIVTFVEMTGVDPADEIVDSMLARLGDMDLLYYLDEYASDKKGKKVEFGKPELKELPHRAPKDRSFMGPANESRIIKGYTDFES
jgi:hypothetical protein